jgi:hypothetical protein
LSSGHHLLDRDERGWLLATDEFIKVYLARPELAVPPDACLAERALHDALLSDPWRHVAAVEIGAIENTDARANWEFVIRFRDCLAKHLTLEATYIALARQREQLPPILLDHLVHLIMRNALDRCDDPYMLRAAELFFRRQRVTVHEGSVLSADAEHLDAFSVSPLAAMFSFSDGPTIEVLSDENAETYWQRSDGFDFALDLTSGRRGQSALGKVIALWIRHMLDIDVIVEPLTELRDVALTWYVGLDAAGTKIGDALWNGAEIDEATRARLVGLFRLTFRDAGIVIDRVGEEPVYLILAMTLDGGLRIKPQNLLVGLPLRGEDAGALT